ncbi:MAG TPA: DUF721 domain-containing protein [Pyrinomonadaceae bacterium]|nr:DUF721 domain-containing protein [Pyrinomonadaceae bacterium]
MDILIKTLPKILAAANGSDEVAEAVCVAAWKHAVGDALSSHAVPVQLKDQTLVVAVRDNIWQRQMEQLRGQLLFRLNSVLGQQTIKSIEVSIQPRMFQALDDEGSNHKQSIAHTAVPIELVSAAAEIRDVGLRRAFLGAAASCVARLEKNREP